MSVVDMAARPSAPHPSTTRPTLAGVNPLARFLGALVIGLTLVLSIDLVSAGVALGLELLLLPWAGIRMRRVALRAAPLLLAAVLAAITTSLYGRDAGTTLVALGPVTITQGSLLLAAAIGVRVLAVGLPAVVLLTGIDPTDLGDALAQVAHLPARFVLGALAGLRLVGLFLEDWRALGMARRARGVGDGGGPLGAARRAGSRAFALLVLAVRRGGVLATAMEVRGFGATGERTWARPSRVAGRDVAFLAVTAAIAAAAVASAVAAGSWAFVLG